MMRSRREFLAAGAAGATALLAAKQGHPQAVTKTQVWVQLTTGGKPYPPTLQEMFLDPIFFGMEVWPIDQPASFAALLPAAAHRNEAAERLPQAEGPSAAGPSGTSPRTTHGNQAAAGLILAMTCSS